MEWANFINKTSNEAREGNIETQFLTDHIAIFRQTINKLASIPCKESSIIQIALLFFDIMSILKRYGVNAKGYNTLSELQIIKETKYTAIHDKQCTDKNRIVAIRRFKKSFSQTLYKGIQD